MRLEPGAQVSTNLTATDDEQHFSVMLEHGQHLGISIEQLGVDVVVTLLDPEGTQLLVVDGPTGPRGAERIDHVCSVSGCHQLLIRRCAGEGSITLRLEEIRVASERQRRLAGALAELCQADALSSGDADQQDLERALALYENAANVWREENQPNRQVSALLWIGDTCLRLGRPDRAKVALQKAVEITQDLGDPWQEAGLLNQLGTAFHRLGRSEEALDAYQRALEAAARAGNDTARGTAISAIGQIHQLHGEMYQALEAYTGAIKIWEEIGYSRGLAYTLCTAAEAFIWMERFEDAEERLQQSLTLARQHQDRTCEATAMNLLGWIQYRRGDPGGALIQYDATLALLRESGERQLEASTLDRYGGALLARGELERARESFQAALAVFRDTTLPGEEAVTVLNYGNLLRVQHQYHEAIGQARRCLPVLRNQGNAHGIAEALLLLARCELALGELHEARGHIVEGIEIIEEIRNQIGLPGLRMSYSSARHEYYELYTEILIQLHERAPNQGYDIAALENAERGRARTLLEMLSAGQAANHSSLKRQQKKARLRELLGLREHRRLQLLTEGAPAREVTKAEAEISYLLRELEMLSRTEISADSLQPMRLAQIRQQLRDRGTQLLLYALGETRSFVWLVDGSSVSYHILPGRAEVEAAAQRTHLLMRRSHFRRSRVQSQLQAEQLGEMLLGPVAGQLVADRLVVVGDGVLQLIPFAALPVPPAAERTPELSQQARRFMVQDYEIVQLPSVSVLAALRRQHGTRPRPAGVQAVIFGDPVFSADDPRLARLQDRALPDDLVSPTAVDRSRDSGFERLPFATQEAMAICQLLPEGCVRMLIGSAASKDAAIDPELAQYQIIHFATHGLLHSQHPELSGLVLSLLTEDGKPRNGFLRAYEISELSLPSELVVLSACQTAEGIALRGEGIINLTRAFMCAGAARIMVSLWNVNDEAAVVFMETFYRNVLQQRLTPAAALRAAQLSMLEGPRWQAPYYWAGFVLQGEWSAIPSAAGKHTTGDSHPKCKPSDGIRHNTLQSGILIDTKPEDQQKEESMTEQDKSKNGPDNETEQEPVPTETASEEEKIPGSQLPPLPGTKPLNRQLVIDDEIEDVDGDEDTQ